jgi:hypothetical protein
MELITLEPTSKIDFGLQHSTLEKRLQRRYHVSELLWNSHRILAALSAQGPLFIGWGQNGRQANFVGSCPDGGRWLSGRTTVRQDFPRFLRRNLSCIRTSSGWDGSIVRTDARPLQVISITGFARPGHGAGASERLNFNTQFPYLMRVSPDHEGETSGRLKSNRQLPYTMLQRPDHSCQMSRRFIMNCDSCLTEIRVRTGYYIVRTVD